MDSLRNLTHSNAVEFLNTAFEALSSAEAADKGHRLDEAVIHYKEFMQGAQTFLTSPVCALYGNAINSAELHAMLPGVKLRLERLLKIRAIRDVPPIPGAILLTGPGAAASISREVEHSFADKAAETAAATKFQADAAIHHMEHELAAEMLRASEAATISANLKVTAHAKTQGLAKAGIPDGMEAAASRSIAYTDPSCAPFGSKLLQRCHACGVPGHCGGGVGTSSSSPAANHAAPSVMNPAAITTLNVSPGSAATESTLAGDTEELSPSASRMAKPTGEARLSANAEVAMVAGGGGSSEVAVGATEAAGGDSSGVEPEASIGGAACSGDLSALWGPQLLRCGRCRQVLYCSPQCQRSHWSRHKAVCRK